MVGRPLQQQQQTDENLNSKSKTNHFDDNQKHRYF
jgi:hypothetical protein